MEKVPIAAGADTTGTYMGRDAISLLIELLALNPEHAVLLPAYLCSEVLNPFLARTRVAFYDVTSTLDVDPDRLKQKLQTGRFELVYIINYFGFLQAYRHDIKTVCANHGSLLVEDCAHSLLTVGSGEVGDVSIFSFRKVLPLPDGGALRTRIRAARTVRMYPRLYSDLLSNLSLVKSYLRVRSATLSRSGISAGAKRVLNAGPAPSSASGRTLPLSANARMMMAKLSPPQIARQRRLDYLGWQALAVRTDVVTPLFRTLPPGVCPVGFPVLAKDRQSLSKSLQGEGVRLRVHWPLPAAVGREHTESHALASRMCTIPVSYELSAQERAAFEKLLRPRPDSSYAPERIAL